MLFNVRLERDNYILLLKDKDKKMKNKYNKICFLEGKVNKKDMKIAELEDKIKKINIKMEQINMNVIGNFKNDDDLLMHIKKLIDEIKNPKKLFGFITYVLKNNGSLMFHIYNKIYKKEMIKKINNTQRLEINSYAYAIQVLFEMHSNNISKNKRNKFARALSSQKREYKDVDGMLLLFV